ncbi:hypothetical protein BDW67DRAFT_155746 [Aspergillus spinulosporus]
MASPPNIQKTRRQRRPIRISSPMPTFAHFSFTISSTSQPIMMHPSRTNRNTTTDLLLSPMSMSTMIPWTAFTTTITTAMNLNTPSTPLYPHMIMTLIPPVLALLRVAMSMPMQITISMCRSMRIRSASRPSHSSCGGSHVHVRCTRHATGMEIL